MLMACLLVRTMPVLPILGGMGAQLASHEGLGCITRIDEKGPCSTFRYGSTQTAKTPIKASNLPIWTCRPPDDGRSGQIWAFSRFLGELVRNKLGNLSGWSLGAGLALLLVGARRGDHVLHTLDLPRRGVVLSWGHWTLGSLPPPIPCKKPRPCTVLCSSVRSVISRSCTVSPLACTLVVSVPLPRARNGFARRACPACANPGGLLDPNKDKSHN